MTVSSISSTGDTPIRQESSHPEKSKKRKIDEVTVTTGSDEVTEIALSLLSMQSRTNGRLVPKKPKQKRAEEPDLSVFSKNDNNDTHGKPLIEQLEITQKKLETLSEQITLSQKDIETIQNLSLDTDSSSDLEEELSSEKREKIQQTIKNMQFSIQALSICLYDLHQELAPAKEQSIDKLFSKVLSGNK